MIYVCFTDRLKTQGRALTRPYRSRESFESGSDRTERSLGWQRVKRPTGAFAVLVRRVLFYRVRLTHSDTKVPSTGSLRIQKAALSR
jgi:hypothetical protein